MHREARRASAGLGQADAGFPRRFRSAWVKGHAREILTRERCPRSRVVPVATSEFHSSKAPSLDVEGTLITTSKVSFPPLQAVLRSAAPSPQLAAGQQAPASSARRASRGTQKVPAHPVPLPPPPPRAAGCSMPSGGRDRGWTPGRRGCRPLPRPPIRSCRSVEAGQRP